MNIPTTYIDKFGSIAGFTQLIDNYHNLTIAKEEFISTFILRIAEAEFISESFDSFQRINGKNKERPLVDDYNRLLNCILIFKLPLRITKNGIDQQSILDFEIALGTETNPMDYQISSQKLTLEKSSITINKGHFAENGFNKLIETLSNDIQLKCCINCAFSGYSVYGQGFFGCMICYRNVKNEYLKIKDKDDYVEIMSKGVGKYMETHYCEDFKLRIPNAGYRIFYD